MTGKEWGAHWLPCDPAWALVALGIPNVDSFSLGLLVGTLGVSQTAAGLWDTRLCPGIQGARPPPSSTAGQAATATALTFNFSVMAQAPDTHIVPPSKPRLQETHDPLVPPSPFCRS